MNSNIILRIRTNFKGFSMIELLVTIAILGVLSGVAITSYQKHVVKSRRAEAQTGLITLIAQAEQYYLQNNNSYPASHAGLTLPSSQFYTFTAASCGTDCFKVTATATGSQLAADSACSPLTLDTKGARTPTTASCWNR